MTEWFIHNYKCAGNAILIFGNKAWIKTIHHPKPGDTLVDKSNSYTIKSISKCKDHCEAELEEISET
jgi:hypothetical protein